MKKKDIVGKEPFYGKAKTKAGKPAKIGTKLVNKDGEFDVVLTPAGKGAKYASELKNNRRYTNKGKPKKDDAGVIMQLSNEQRAYRAGYLDARKDNAKAYNAKKNSKK